MFSLLKYKRFFLGLVFLSFSQMSHAGLLVEPYLNYTSGSLQLTSLAGDESKYEYSGPDIGLRLGYKFIIPWFALDYSGSVGSSGKTDLINYEATRNQLGAVIGVDVPFGVRLYAGYGFQNDLNLKNGVSELKFSGGNSTKIGIGLGMIPLLSINFEYCVNKYNKFSNETTEAADIAGTYSKQNFTTTHVSISAPFNL